ncbi:hemagglutinin repeat-containing protein [Actinobacillus porcinus]|uniref:hemagglutinin repeat-containing protein n=1 Tax=Actinobacillus porcinus TaxID=51048 RepID=UPI002354C7BC|nr:hemagglutinin repeat-containing protein [Actinobacillus porcinus]
MSSDYMFPAANVTHADEVLSGLQTGKQRESSEGSIRIENHQQDPVGSLPILLGGNPATMDDNSQNRGFIRRTLDMFGDNSSIGTNGIGFTAGRKYGKGYDNGDESTSTYSHVGDKNSQTTLESGATTNLKGAQVQGKGVKLDAQNLNIESLQETLTYKGKQMNVSGQVTVGYGFSASGSYNQSKMNAD